MGEFTMPSLGADMDSGTLLEWRVGVGDHVERGDIVAVVDTEKSAVEVEVFESGVIDELLVQPGTEVEVGTPLARISTAVGTTPRPPAPEPAAAPARPTPVPLPPTPEHLVPDHPTSHSEPRVVSPLVRHLADELGVDTGHVAGHGAGGRVTRADVEDAGAHRRPVAVPLAPGGASPLARRQAAESGIDLATVTGTGPGGAVRARDLTAPAQPAQPAPPAPTPAAPASPTAPAQPVAARSGDERARSMRQAIARLMTISNAEIPHYHLARTIDVEACVEWLAARNATRPASERVLLAALLLRATALATAAHPELNGHWVDGGFRAAEGVQLGVAVAVRGGGLITPVMHDAQLLDVDATMATLRDLVTRARRAALRSSDLSPASITVTDLGDRGADEVFGVIHPPQVALVGFGRVAERPWATDGLLGVRHTVRATLSADHRATDGHVGSGLLATISELLGDPDRLDRPPDRPRGAA